MSNSRKALPRLSRVILGWAALSTFGLCHADNVQVFPEPWQVLEPGKPPEIRPRIEIVTEGRGAIIEPGNLVQITEKYFFFDRNEFGTSREWWLWIGFGASAQTAFPSVNPALRSGLLNIKEGTSFKFLDLIDNPILARRLYTNPFGDPKYYSWRKNIQKFGEISVPTKSAYSLIEIKRVCKGQAKYRTVRLLDDSAVERCTWAPLHCEKTRTPREGWIDEAKIEAICQDGKTATFQYGPVTSGNGKEWSGPINPGNYFNPWIKSAWEKIPVGVQLK